MADKRLQILLSPNVVEMLEELAKHEELPKRFVLARLIRDAYAVCREREESRNV